MRGWRPVLIGLLCLPLAARAQEKDAAAHWRALTQMDVEAAHRLLADNHPAATPDAKDPIFPETLKKAYADARGRAAKATNYPGYVATLGAFANAMGDGHIWSHPLYVPNIIEWTGLMTVKRGPNWVIASEDKDIVGEDVTGGRIVSCDDIPVDDFARDTLGRYQRVWGVEAMRVLAAPRLLVDEGNPFVKRPTACVVEKDGAQHAITLHWTKILRTTFLASIKGVTGKAGFGVRRVGAGTWIAIETLSVKAQAVIDAAKAQAEQLRNAPYVVIDVRGNGGGDDDYGRKLADVLYGHDYALSRIGEGGESESCRPVWRASPENIKAVDAQAHVFAETGETAGAKEYGEAVVAMKKAEAGHHALTGAPTCTPPQNMAVAAKPPSLMHGRVFLLTDSVCFSSCINMAEFFRKLGATLVGQTTGADTHFSEVREITLPSGLSNFSTLQAIESDMPRAIGPFAPDIPYDGDISDTAALEKWIAEIAVKGSASR
ncbi:MAG TPA: S41 family peptidase [Rhizomicrobium sp.]|nr:S41 family peptidase [Rhizomicrobium sp.]